MILKTQGFGHMEILGRCYINFSYVQELVFLRIINYSRNSQSFQVNTIGCG